MERATPNANDRITAYRVNETFWTIQGEGEHAGRTAVFLRLQGCPVGCHWCDSKLTWYGGGTVHAGRDLALLTRRYAPSDLVVITGGEPLIWNLDDLLAALSTYVPKNVLITLETSGAYPFKGERRPHWTTISPKYAAGWAVAENVLRVASELKYVVDETFAPEVVREHLAHFQALTNRAYPLPAVRLMPEGSPPRPEMVARTMALLAEYPNWRFGPRLQYAYPTIAEAEGLNNKIVTVETARAYSRQLARARKEGE